MGNSADRRINRITNYFLRKFLADQASDDIGSFTNAQGLMMKDQSFRFQLIRRALLHKKAKALLIVLAVAMGASVVTALLNLEYDLRSRMNRELRDYGPNVLLIPDATSQQKLLPPSSKEIVNDPNLKSVILAYTPELLVAGELKSETIMITGAELKSLKKLYPGWAWQPSQINNEGTYAGVRLAKKLELRNGDQVQLISGKSSISVRISGTIESGEAEDDQLFVPISTAQQLISRDDAVQLMAISALGDAPDVEKRFGSALKNRHGIQFQLIRKIASAEETILNRISNLMTLVISIIFITLFFCINTTVSAILLARQSEIALLRILGARRKQIMAGLTSELLILAIIGGLIGFAGGIFVAQILGKILFQTYIEPHLRIFFITILASMAMMILCSFLPIRRAINRQAAAVLREA
jgi:putative ABC transport system permease protein